jgi:hypothetical protein
MHTDRSFGSRSCPPGAAPRAPSIHAIGTETCRPASCPLIQLTRPQTVVDCLRTSTTAENCHSLLCTGGNFLPSAENCHSLLCGNFCPPPTDSLPIMWMSEYNKQGLRNLGEYIRFARPPTGVLTRNKGIGSRESAYLWIGPDLNGTV